MFNFSKKASVVAPAPAVVAPAPKPEPTKLERLVAKRTEEVAREKKAQADFERAQKEAELVKAEYQAKVNALRAEKEALNAIAQEIRSAISAADKASERAKNAQISLDNMVNTYANDLAVGATNVESFADSLLEEFGC